MTSTEESVGSPASPTAPVSSNGNFTLSNILCVLRPLEDKYVSLGTHLGVELEDIKRIEGDYPKNERRFTETIRFWQNNCRINQSWSVLADAIEKVGGHGGLVRRLRASESSSSEDAGYSTKVSDSPSSGSDIEYFDKAPGCSCDKPCSVYTISSGRCPKPTNTKVGIVRKRTENQATRGVLLPEEMVDSEEEDYTEEFEKETKKMRVQFAGLVDDVSNSLEKRNVTTDRAVLFLQNVHPLLKSRIDDMTKASSIQKVLTIVTSQACSWFDYEIIKDLVGKLGDEHDRKLLSEYEAKFKEFAEQRKLPNGKKHIEIGSGARKGGKQLVIKIDKEWNEVNFNDLDKIRNNLASILNVKKRDLYLADVREGCVMMTFMITEELAETLFPKKNDLTSSKLSSYFSSSQLKLLQNEGIILLTCGKVSWRPAMEQSLSEPQEKSLVYSNPLDSHPDSPLDRQKLESRSPILGSPKEASGTEQSTVVTADGSGDQVMGNEAVRTPSCITFIEREEWTEAFRIPIQLSPAFIGSDMSSRTFKGNLYTCTLMQSQSQDSGFHSLTSLPPRPEESDSDDPDYSYIDENEVKGPESQSGKLRTMSSRMSGGRGRVSSPTLDDQLEELKKSIMRENKKKKRDKVANQGRREAITLHFSPRSSPRSRLPMNFSRTKPDDYLKPMASKRLTSMSSEGVPRRGKLSLNIDKMQRSRSENSAGRGVHGAVQNLTKEENYKSLPDINNISPFPENNLALNRQHHGHSVSREHNHGHSCSKCSVGSSTDGFMGGAATSNDSLPASSSSQNFEYLQLLSEEEERRPQVQQQADIDTDVSPALDLLSRTQQPLPQQPAGRPSKVRNSSSSSLVSNSMNVAPPRSIQSTTPVFSPAMSIAPPLLMRGAPPVPPNSLVSLRDETQQLPHAARVQQPPPHYVKRCSFSGSNWW